jgi:hypothetical protein
MQIDQVIAQCQRETGFRGNDAKDICLLALILSGQAKGRELRMRVRDTYIQASPERGSFFLLVVLPILISIISNWVAKWILDRSDMRSIRSQAFDAAIESLPGMAAIRISTSSVTETSTSPNAPSNSTSKTNNSTPTPD